VPGIRSLPEGCWLVRTLDHRLTQPKVAPPGDVHRYGINFENTPEIFYRDKGDEGEEDVQQSVENVERKILG